MKLLSLTQVQMWIQIC